MLFQLLFTQFYSTSVTIISCSSLHVVSARPTIPFEEQRTVDVATTAITTKRRHQCGTARTVTSSCVVMTTVLESTISNMAHQVRTKHYPTYFHCVTLPWPSDPISVLSLSHLSLSHSTYTHSHTFMYTWQCILTLHAHLVLHCTDEAQLG